MTLIGVIRGDELTTSLDLDNRSNWDCVIDETGTVVDAQRVSTTAKALREASDE